MSVHFTKLMAKITSKLLDAVIYKKCGKGRHTRVLSTHNGHFYYCNAMECNIIQYKIIIALWSTDLDLSLSSLFLLFNVHI